MKIHLPRTARDFRQIETLIYLGYSNSQIKDFQRDYIWLSDVNQGDGYLSCTLCFQKISVTECLNCGQTLHLKDQANV
jgi:hypothetical protein